MANIFLLMLHFGFITPAIELIPTKTLHDPVGVVFDPSANMLYISNRGGGTLTKIDLHGAEEQTWVAGLSRPGALALGNNQIFVVETNHVVSIDLATKKMKKVAIEAAGTLSGVAVAEDGRVFVADIKRNQIYRLQDDKATIWSSGAHLHQPNGLNLQDDQLYIACQGGPTVLGEIRIIPLIQGAITSQWSEPVGRLYGLSPDGDYGFYVTDRERGQVLRLTDDGGSKILASDLDRPSGLVAIPEKNLLIIVETGKNRLVKLAL